MKTALSILVVLLWTILFTCSYQPHQSSTIRITGSDTMRILMLRWAEEYMKRQSNTSVYIEGGGTVQGINDLIKGKADICAASRPIRSDEVRLLAEKYGKIGISFLVAKDALSIYLHNNNKVKNLTKNQVKKIFTGEIENWQQVGGNDTGILVLIRSPNSGTYLYFKDHILDGEAYSANAKTMPTTKAIVRAIIEHPEAISYGGIAYGPNVFHCKINDIAPTEENVRNDTYPIIRYLYFYTVDTPAGPVRDFINWVLSEGQRFVKDVGYIPLWVNPGS